MSLSSQMLLLYYWTMPACSVYIYTIIISIIEMIQRWAVHFVTGNNDWTASVHDRHVTTSAQEMKHHYYYKVYINYNLVDINPDWILTAS